MLTKTRILMSAITAMIIGGVVLTDVPAQSQIAIQIGRPYRRYRHRYHRTYWRNYHRYHTYYWR